MEKKVGQNQSRHLLLDISNVASYHVFWLVRLRPKYSTLCLQQWGGCKEH